MAYSIDAITDGCYPGTTCLINKLGIQDESVLAETEAAVVLGKASLLDQQPIQGEFDFDHYKRIHHFLFCDLYDWAGQVHSISISKKGTPFVSPDEIESCAGACFKRLSTFHPDGLSHRQLAEEVADFYHTINMLHPFREGNGRSTRELIRCMALEYGLHINWGNTDRETLINAAIAAVDDDMAFCDVLRQCIE